MSALAYLLVDDMYMLYPDYDPKLRAIVMCSIVVLQIVAPLLVYRSLSRWPNGAKRNAYRTDLMR